jgi:tRNA A37 N6-isopentenylltransferase MiaA
MLQFAKRQLTRFRALKNLKWIELKLNEPLEKLCRKL